MNHRTPTPIVLVHGFWVTPRSWEHWITHYEAKGFTVLTPAYPGFEVEVEALRADPTPIAEADIIETIDHLDRGRRRPSRRRRSSWATRSAARSPRCCSTTASGAAGVAINSAPTEGVRVNPLSQVEVHVPGAEEPGQPAQGRRASPRAVALRLHQHLRPRRPRRPRTSATTSRRPAAGLGLRAARQLQARPPGHLGRLPQRRPGAAAVHLRQRGPHHAAGGEQVERQALQKSAHHHRVPRVRGPRPLACAEPGWEEIADYALDWALATRNPLGDRVDHVTDPDPGPGGPCAHPHRRARRC